MKILLIEDDSDLRELVSMFLMDEFNVQVVQAESGNQAIALLIERADFDCVISDYHMPDGTGGDVYTFMESKELKIPFVLLSSDRPENIPELSGRALAGALQKPDFSAALRTLVADMLRKAGKKVPEPAPYCRIRRSVLLKVNMLHCDLYLKLSDKKYVKVFNRGDSFGADDVERYGAKQVEYFYINKADSESFIDKFTQDLISTAKAKEDLDVGSAFQISTSAHEAMHEITKQLGFTDRVRRFAEAGLNLALAAIEHNPSLAELLKRVPIDNENYLSNHSVLTAFVACSTAGVLKWESEPTAYKLALASLLHDITLEDDRLARVRSLDQVTADGTDLNGEDREQIRCHPKDAAALLTNFDNLPPDIDTIILHHHELPDGSGFPSGLPHTRISPLACVFIVAHDLVRFFLDHDAQGSLAPFFEEARPRYEIGQFKKIFSALAKSSGS